MVRTTTDMIMFPPNLCGGLLAVLVVALEKECHLDFNRI